MTRGWRVAVGESRGGIADRLFGWAARAGTSTFADMVARAAGARAGRAPGAGAYSRQSLRATRLQATVPYTVDAHEHEAHEGDNSFTRN